MLPDRAYEDHYTQLQSIVSKIILKRSSNFADLFAHEKFMPFVDMFQKESVKVVFIPYISLLSFYESIKFTRIVCRIRMTSNF